MTSKQKFKSAIKRGTGEAHLLMKDNPTVDFSNHIIKAALTNLSYDPQSEGSRAHYIFELIELSHQKKKIRKAILNGLATEKEDTWALDQLFDLTALFAKQGDKKAKKAIYKRYSKKKIEASDWVGETVIIELDGLKGLKYIAKTKGKIIKKKPGTWEDSSLIDSFHEMNPYINAYKELKSSAQTNKFIGIYLNTVKKYTDKRKKTKRPKLTYKIVKERIDNDSIIVTPPLWIKELSDSDITKLADGFLKENNRNKLEKYLQIFSEVKYPYNYAPILTLVKSKTKKDDRLVEYAVKALKHFSGDDIRLFALKKLEKFKKPYQYLNLLVSNYKKKDSTLLTKIGERCKNEHDIHELVYGFIDIYQANATTECKKPLEAIYNKLTCGIHRIDIIKIFITNNVLSKQLKKEIQFDSYLDTRELFNLSKPIQC
jgi:hypothetical protein